MATKTIQATGGDYATIALWEDYVDSVNGTGILTEDEIGQINNEELTTTAVTTFAGSTPGAFNIILEAQSGESFRDHANKLTNRQAYVSTYGACVRRTSGSGDVFSIDDANVIIRNLMIKKDSNYGNIIYYADIANTGQVIDSCIIEMASNTQVAGIEVRSGTIKNTLVVMNASGNSVAGMYAATGTVDVQNCVFANIGTAGTTSGIVRTYATLTVTNTAVYNFGTDASGTMSGTNNATDESSSGLPATNLQTSLTGSTEWENVSSGTHDFRLKSTSAKLKDNGTASGVPSTDIIGQARSGSTDIGQWEYQTGGAASIVPILNSYRQRSI